MVKQFIDGCTACQQMKPNTHPTAAPLMPIKSHAHRPFQQITTDLITNSPPKQRLDLIFYRGQSKTYKERVQSTQHHDLRQKTATRISRLQRQHRLITDQT